MPKALSSTNNIIFIVLFSLSCILLNSGNVLAGGEGGGGGDGSSSAAATPDRGWGSDATPSSATSAGDISTGTGGSVTSVVATVDTISTTHGIVSVGLMSDGTYGLSSPERGDGGVYGTGYSYTPPVDCTSAADIVVTGLSFARNTDPDTYIKSTNLDTGYSYIPAILVANTGCLDTNEGSVGTNFKNENPKGENGRFPVRLQIDFGSDGEIDYSEVVNNVGPLKAGESIVVAFPNFIANNNGDHEAVATADPHSMPIVGCSGGWGCVKEIDETNKGNFTFSISEAWVDLGSFVWTDSKACTYDLEPGGYSYTTCGRLLTPKEPVERGLYRTVEDSVYSATDPNEEIGLLWDGNKVVFSSCTGNRTDFDGRYGKVMLTSHFTIPTPRANKTFSRNLYDLDIDEPAYGKTHTYTITCNTDSGSQVGDTHILNGGGVDLSDLVLLTPTVAGRTVSPNELLRLYNFTAANDGLVAVDNFIYSILIDGEDVTRGGGSAPISKLEVGKKTNVAGTINWRAPAIETKLPVEVCVSHPDMDGDRCNNAFIVVDELIDTECSDRIDNDGDGTADYRGTSVYDPDPGCDSDDDDDESEDPTITADPTIVRSGETTTVEWDPRGNTKCELSKNTGVSSKTNSPGSTSVPIVAETIFTISCEDDEGAIREASVTVKALPVMYET